MKRRVLEINKADPTAVFSLYVDDLRCRLGYDWFVAQGIDSARVKVSLLSDGTATYNNFYNYFGDPATAQQNWETYAAEVEALDWNHGGRYPETRAEFELESWTWPYYLATRPGYRLVMQNGALLESSCPFITDKLREMQIEDIQPYEMLSALSESARRLFYDMAGFDYDKFAALFDASPKGNLIIIGTSHQNAASEQQQRDYVARIVGQYGAAYDIFFKPHPADTSSASYETDFPGLTLLPGQMPFEIFVWSLMDHVDMIGGYPSTVFLTVPVDKVRFIFAPDAESLVRPLAQPAVPRRGERRVDAVKTLLRMWFLRIWKQPVMRPAVLFAGVLPAFFGSCPVCLGCPSPPFPAAAYREAASDEGVTPSEFLAQSPRARSTCSTMSRTAPSPPLNSET